MWISCFPVLFAERLSFPLWIVLALVSKIVWVSDSHSVVSDSIAQSGPMDYSQPAPLSMKFSGRILEWVAISFCRESFWPRDPTQVSCIAGRFFTTWATREVHVIWYSLQFKGRKQTKTQNKTSLHSKTITQTIKIVQSMTWQLVKSIMVLTDQDRDMRSNYKYT